MPATPANIHKLAPCILPMNTPITIPRKARTDETELYTRACLIDIPALNNTAKSPERK